MATSQEHSAKASSLYIIVATVREIVAAERLWFTIMLLMAMLSGAIPIIAALVVADAVANIDQISIWDVILLASALSIPSLVSSASDLMSQYVTRKMGLGYQHDHARLVLSAHRSQLEDAKFLDTIRIAEQARHERLTMGVSIIPGTVQIAITSGGFFIGVLRLNWLLAIVVLVPAAFWTLTEKRIARLYVRLSRATARVRRRLGFRLHEICIPDIADQIRTTAAPDFMMSRHSNDLRQIFSREVRLDKSIFAIRIAQAVVTFVSLFFAYQWLSAGLHDGSITVGELVFTIYAFSALVVLGPSVAGITRTIHAIQIYDPELTAYESYRNHNRHRQDPVTSLEDNGRFLNIRNEDRSARPLLLDLTSLKVIRNDREVLSSPPLRLDSGAMVAFTGPNGSGKSTLLRCIAGLVRPDEGRVLYLGRDVADLEHPNPVVGYMPQTPHIFEMTLSDNIALGRPTTTGHLFSLFRSIGATTWLDHSESCLQWHLGGLLADERSIISRPSYGEQLKLGLARTLHDEHPVLLLDEPTEGLDSTSSSIVIDSLLARTAGGSIVIVATHDDELIRVCDTVIDLSSDDGEQADLA